LAGQTRQVGPSKASPLRYPKSRSQAFMQASRRNCHRRHVVTNLFVSENRQRINSLLRGRCRTAFRRYLPYCQGLARLADTRRSPEDDVPRFIPGHQRTVPASQRTVPASQRTVPAFQRAVRAYQRAVRAYQRAAGAYPRFGRSTKPSLVYPPLESGYPARFALIPGRFPPCPDWFGAALH
jgi:hypothetical protein